MLKPPIDDGDGKKDEEEGEEEIGHGHGKRQTRQVDGEIVRFDLVLKDPSKLRGQPPRSLIFWVAGCKCGGSVSSQISSPAADVSIGVPFDGKT